MSHYFLDLKNNCDRGKSKAHISYITRGESDWEVFGVDGQDKIEKRKHLKQVWDQWLDNGKSMSRSDYRTILSIPKSDCDYETFKAMVYEFRRKTYKYNIGCVAVHQDKPDHYDAHIIVNARTIGGKAVQMDKGFSHRAKSRWQEIGAKHGVSIEYDPHDLTYEERGEMWAKKKAEREKYKQSIASLNETTPVIKMAQEKNPEVLAAARESLDIPRIRNIHERAAWVRDLVMAFHRWLSREAEMVLRGRKTLEKGLETKSRYISRDKSRDDLER